MGANGDDGLLVWIFDLREIVSLVEGSSLLVLFSLNCIEAYIKP